MKIASPPCCPRGDCDLSRAAGKRVESALDWRLFLPERVPMTSGKNRGFSLLELLITIAIGLCMAGITFMAMKPLLNENHVDQAYDTTLSVVRNYRNLSITNSKRFIVYFTAPRTI